LRKKGDTAPFFIPKCTDRIFLRYRYGKYREIPTEYRPKIPNRCNSKNITLYKSSSRGQLALNHVRKSHKWGIDKICWPNTCRKSYVLPKPRLCMFIRVVYRFGIFGRYSVGISRYLPYRYRRKTRSVQFGIKKGAVPPFFLKRGAMAPFLRRSTPF
jgi:hypothetical protein